MASRESEQLKRLAEDARNGNTKSRDLLVEHSYRRLRILAKKILRESFPKMARIHETDSVLHEAIIKLMTSLRNIELDSLQHYLRLAARIIRNTLIDLARARRVRNHLSLDQLGNRDSEGVARFQAPADTGDPEDRVQRDEALEKFLRAIEGLPEDERNVVDLHLIQGFSQADIAEMLERPPKEISRTWLRAKSKLPEWIH